MAIGPDSNTYNTGMYNQPGYFNSTNITSIGHSTPVYTTTSAVKSEYLPKTEETDFFIPLLENHCSNNDVKELLLILFEKLAHSPQEELKISPEVVTALLTFCIERYA